LLDLLLCSISVFAKWLNLIHLLIIFIWIFVIVAVDIDAWEIWISAWFTPLPLRVRVQIHLILGPLLIWNGLGKHVALRDETVQWWLENFVCLLHDEH
jgi:hypothetical protein